MTHVVNKYAEFISRQLVKEGTGENKEITAKIQKTKKIEGSQDTSLGRDAEHAFSKGDEHVYHTNPGGRDTAQYIVHNSKTNKMHLVTSGIESGEPTPKHQSVSANTLKAIHKHATTE
jgi:hypothetical protein